MVFSVLRKFDMKILAVGHLVFHSFDYGFDYVLYPYVIYKYGVSFGYVIMALLSAAICLVLSSLYDWLRKDWLGIETVKELVEEFFAELKEEAEVSWRRRGKKILSWIFHKNIIGQFVFLSIKFDPLITTVYMRKGYHRYNGFTWRDWKIFWGSVLISNLWWTGVSLAIVSVVKESISRFF